VRQVDPVGFAVWVALASAIGAFPKGTPHRFWKSVAVFVPAAVLGSFAADSGGFLGLFVVGSLAWFAGRITSEFTSKPADGPSPDAGVVPAAQSDIQSTEAVGAVPPSTPPVSGAPPTPTAPGASPLWRTLIDTGWGRLYVVASVTWLAWRIYAVHEVAMEEWGNWRHSDLLNVMLTGIALPLIVGAAGLWVARGFRQRAEPSA